MRRIDGLTDDRVTDLCLECDIDVYVFVILFLLCV